MTDWLKEALIIGLPSLATGLAGWLFGRRKQKEEIHTLEMANTAKAIELWRETGEEYSLKYERVSKELKLLQDAQVELMTEYRKLHRENLTGNRKIEALEKKVTNQSRKITEQSQKIEHLEKENLQLREQLDKKKDQ